MYKRSIMVARNAVDPEIRDPFISCSMRLYVHCVGEAFYLGTILREAFLRACIQSSYWSIAPIWAGLHAAAFF